MGIHRYLEPQGTLTSSATAYNFFIWFIDLYDLLRDKLLNPLLLKWCYDVLCRIIKLYIEVIVFWIDWCSSISLNPHWYFYQYKLFTVSQIHRKPYIAAWFNHLQRVRKHRGLDYSTNDCECSGCCVCLCICRCLIMNHLKLPPLMTLGCWISLTNVLSQCLSLWKISLRLLPSD